MFRFGPLVWRSSKERKKGNKAARNAKCNSGDSGIQIEMVSGGALTGGSGGGVIGGGDSSESHDTDDVPDDTDSPPALRRRVADKSRPQSELINQILIDKFKVNSSFLSLIIAPNIFRNIFFIKIIPLCTTLCCSRRQYN
ncbi:uncharacterized protein LOC112552338 [Pogonomyrmex barbatus]|uniref:Uncharacterized protein LOC112552338 n=1 Tax=Pogonomyrmex barbatus TaxID=144034 RepID=A0A8N1S391_9HYME|nr:uncharacterized protein LOC112552338 [Pogonomyrmex barbatus]